MKDKTIDHEPEDQKVVTKSDANSENSAEISAIDKGADVTKAEAAGTERAEEMTKLDESVMQQAATSEDKTSGVGAEASAKASDASRTIRDKGKRSGFGLALVSLCLNLAIIVVAFFAWKALQKPLEDQRQLLSGLHETNEKLRLHGHDAKDFTTDIQRLHKQQQQQKQQFDFVQDAIMQMQKRVANLTTTTQQDWLFAEAEYLLRLANQRVLMGKDIVGAESLLLAADQILREINDTTFFSVRDAIAQDVATIRLLDKVDVTGIYLELSSVIKHVDDLKLENEFQSLEIAESNQLTDPNIEEAFLTRLWQSSKEILSRYITVQYDDENSQHLMLPEEHYYRTQNLRFMLEQARLGLLSSEQLVYENSLAEAISWLNRYFPKQDLAMNMMENLQTLRKHNIALDLPDISGSLTALQQYIQLNHSGSSGKNTQPQVLERPAASSHSEVDGLEGSNYKERSSL